MGDQLAGLIVKEQSGFYWVEAADGSTYMCELRGRLKEEAKTSDIAAIGDRATISTRREEGTDVLMGAIESLAPRHSVLSRAQRTTGKRGVGQAEREQVVIANADRALFVFAAAQPGPDLDILDRLLVAGEKSGIADLLIVLNKIDLEYPPAVDELMAGYEGIGYRVLRTRPLRADGLAETEGGPLAGGISVMTGPSGVGKTSLLNRIQPGLGRQVKAVGRQSEEGVHTTRDSALIRLDDGGYIADTPGIRSINVWTLNRTNWTPISSISRGRFWIAGSAIAPIPTSRIARCKQRSRGAPSPHAAIAVTWNCAKSCATPILFTIASGYSSKRFSPCERRARW